MADLAICSSMSTANSVNAITLMINVIIAINSDSDRPMIGPLLAKHNTIISENN
jgi:hypothetical protein